VIGWLMLTAGVVLAIDVSGFAYAMHSGAEVGGNLAGTASVDRRFDRARYDADRTSAAFSDRLRNEVDLAAVAADFRETVRNAIAPSSVGVWLRVGER
jgi:hypothetical protein